jgi:hypothetical protein
MLTSTVQTWKISIGLIGNSYHKSFVLTCDREDLDLFTRDLTEPGIKCKIELVENILAKSLTIPV